MHLRSWYSRRGFHTKYFPNDSHGVRHSYPVLPQWLTFATRGILDFLLDATLNRVGILGATHQVPVNHFRRRNCSSNQEIVNGRQEREFCKFKNN